jgi:hypothetical protein
MSTSTNTKRLKFEWWEWAKLQPTPYDSHTEARD